VLQSGTWQEYSGPVGCIDTVQEMAQGSSQTELVHSLRQQVVQLEQSNASLRRSNALFQSIYDTANLIILAHDRDYRVIYMNDYACRVLGYVRDEMIGQHIGKLIGDWGEAERGAAVRQKLEMSPSLNVDGFEQYYSRRDGSPILIRWTVSALHDTEGQWIGLLGVGQDVTEQHKTEQEALEHRQHLQELVQERTEQQVIEINEQLHQAIARRREAEDEREKVIAKLQDALERVRTLSGLLPICSSCKRVRDDDGYWHQVEVYIRDRSEAEFSHGICPDCATKLYPELYPTSDQDRSIGIQERPPHAKQTL
jgi:PAS domain S-box-containing protein